MLTTTLKKVKEWFSTLKQSLKSELRIKNNYGIEIKLTDFPIEPGTIIENLKYEVFRHQHRNVTMVFIMETLMGFNDIKASMLTWLKKQNYMMNRHNFNTKTLDIVKIGFLVGKHPTDTHRESLHEEIKTKINQMMLEMTPA
jgi:hypothetical protein